MPNKIYEANLEGLRGLAAFMIVFCHIYVYNDLLDPGYKISAIGNYAAPGHFSVLIFFCLSGYVIGITNTRLLETKHDVSTYLQKRFIRLYPIYLVSILAIVYFMHSGQMRMLFTHLTFTQVLLSQVFSENNPLWSLNYEVIFYLLFIPLCLFKISHKKAWVIVMLLAFINAGLHTWYNTPSLLSSYLFGFVFWLSGLIMSDHAFEKNSTGLSNNFVLSLFCLALSNNYIIQLPANITNFLAFPDSVTWVRRALPFSDMLILPFCIVFILLLTNIRFKYRMPILIILYAFPLISFINAFLSYNLSSLAVPLVFYCISLLFLNNNLLKGVSVVIVKTFIYLGSISYAVYAMHFPVLSYFHLVTFFSGSLLTFCIRMLIYLSVLIAISVLLEKYMQPRAKKYLTRLFSR